MIKLIRRYVPVTLLFTVVVVALYNALEQDLNYTVIDKRSTHINSNDSSQPDDAQDILKEVLDANGLKDESIAQHLHKDKDTLGDSIPKSNNEFDQNADICPPLTNFKGPIPADTEPVHNRTALEASLSFVSPGGRWRPGHCRARSRVAVLIPLRDRDQHLQILLRHLHPFLRDQQLEYAFFVVEQTQKEVFNKALMFNAGFLEITARFGDYYDCYILHDVDLLPEDDRIVYNCSSPPRHLGAYVDRVGYRAAYSFCSGGVLEITGEDYRKAGGYSNLYFGWGAEDDDFSLRMFQADLRFTRYPQEWAHYKNIRHRQSQSNPRGYRYFLKGKERIAIDGVHTATYRLVKYSQEKLFSHLLVEVDHLTVFREFARRAVRANMSLDWLHGELGPDTFSMLGIPEPSARPQT